VSKGKHQALSREVTCNLDPTLKYGGYILNPIESTE